MMTYDDIGIIKNGCRDIDSRTDQFYEAMQRQINTGVAFIVAEKEALEAIVDGRCMAGKVPHHLPLAGYCEAVTIPPRHHRIPGRVGTFGYVVERFGEVYAWHMAGLS